MIDSYQCLQCEYTPKTFILFIIVMTKGIFKQVTIRFSEVKRNQQSML